MRSKRRTTPLVLVLPLVLPMLFLLWLEVYRTPAAVDAFVGCRSATPPILLPGTLLPTTTTRRLTLRNEEARTTAILLENTPQDVDENNKNKNKNTNNVATIASTVTSHPNAEPKDSRRRRTLTSIINEDTVFSDQEECTINEDTLLSDCEEFEWYNTNLHPASTATVAAGIGDQEEAQCHSGTSRQSNTAAATAVTATSDDHRPAHHIRILDEFHQRLVATMYAQICSWYPTATTTATPPTSEDRRHLRYERFYVVETLARVPYFAALSVLHLRETFGERRRFPPSARRDDDATADHARIEHMRRQYAQADNRAQHLRIVESLIVDTAAPPTPAPATPALSVWDRCLAQSLGMVGYWYVVLIYLFHDPSGTCVENLMDCLEQQAYSMYDQFLSDYPDELSSLFSSGTATMFDENNTTHPHVVQDDDVLPAITMARQYYEIENSYFLDVVASSSAAAAAASKATRTTTSLRREPKLPLTTLYDVFVNIRDDEMHETFI